MKILNKSPLFGEFRIIRVTPDDVRIYKNINGHKFGVVFTEEFAFDKSITVEVWGFGPTVETAINNLFKLNEEYEAFYRRSAIHFEYDGDVNG